MNKKLNSALLLVVGTLVNIVLAVACIAVLMVLVSFLKPFVGESIVNFIPFAIIGGVILAMIIYQRLMAWVMDKFKLGDHMDPLFQIRRKPPKRD
ncbi:MAG TPA: hypothetical protein PKO22_01110 [Treponemataceae bacterium]|nr:hypothetical protein [Treponemataceae bacterium]